MFTVISSSDGEVRACVMSKTALEKKLNEKYWGERLPSSLLPSDLSAVEGLWCIPGEPRNPKTVFTVKQWSMDP